MNIHVARGLRCFLITTAGLLLICHLKLSPVLLYVLGIIVIMLCACYIVYEMFTLEDDNTFSTLISLSFIRTVLPALMRDHAEWFGNAKAFMKISGALTFLTLIAFFARAIYEDHKRKE